MSKGFFAFASAASVIVAAVLCFYGKEGWGWFLLVGLLIAGAAA